MVVADEKAPPDDGDTPSSSPETTGPRTSSGDDVESCARGLRDGEGIKNPEGQATYIEALAAERAGDMMTARKTYFNVIQNNPRSGLIPLAYLAFGELFRIEAQSDPSKGALAEQAYREVVKYPPPDNTSYAYAWLRLGDTQAKSDPTNALNDYKKAIEAGTQFQNTPCAVVIGSDAKKKLTAVYAQVGQASKAHVFFRSVAGDAAAVGMLEDLVESYRRQNKLSDACAAAQAASSPRLTELAREVCKKP